MSTSRAPSSRLLSLLATASISALGACESDAAPATDTGSVFVPDTSTGLDTSSPPDTSMGADTATPDTSTPDTGLPDTATPDTAPPDTAGPTVPLAGFGLITGECGVLDTELTDSGSSVIVNAIDFGTDPFDEPNFETNVRGDFDLLTADGQELINDGNAGGSSLLSEVFSMEVLARCELARLLASETEVAYDPAGSKKTDILVEIDGLKIAVSVTRAVGFPFDAPYTVEQARAVLDKKLAGIAESNANVTAEFKWRKQMLHVIAYGDPHVTAIRTAWDAIAPEVRGDTVLIITVTQGADAPLY